MDYTDIIAEYANVSLMFYNPTKFQSRKLCVSHDVSYRISIKSSIEIADNERGRRSRSQEACEHFAYRAALR